MRAKYSYLNLFLIIAFAVLPCYGADPCMIKVDINIETANDDANTQVGFTPFTIANSGSEVNGVAIDFGGNIESRRRANPSGLWSGGVYYPRAGERIYRDFIFGVNPSGVTITLWGLGVNRDCNVTIWAFDEEDVIGNLIANWYANGTHILDTNFIGGSANWPNYEAVAPQDLYKWAFSGTATTDEFGRIILTSSRGPSSPTVLPFAYVNALMVVPEGTYVPSLYAQHPVPIDGAEDIPADVIFEWKEGRYAETHDVYLGTNFNDVNDANRSNTLGVLVSQDQSATTYDPPGVLDLNTTYYWRIDEVNGAHDYSIFRGEVSGFKTSLYFVLDNFNSYANDAALQGVWQDGGTSAEVSVETAVVRSGQSMKYEYKKNLPPYYSEASADIGDLGIGPNWLGIGAQALVLYFYGDPTNHVEDKMYVKVTDSDDPAKSATIFYGDMNDVRLLKWTKWSIPLTAFADANLANVAKITIGFGDGSSGSPPGTVYFDDVVCSTTTLSVSPTSLSVAAEVNSAGTFDVNSNTNWTVSSNQTWLTVSPTSGSNNETVTVKTSQENSGPSARTAKVTVNGAGDTLQTVTVTQSSTGGEECTIPPIPTFSSLPTNPKFPDPFTVDGSCIDAIAEWPCRRAEIATLVQEFELGYKQDTNYSATTGSYDSNTLTVTVNDNGKMISFSCSISYPSTESAPYPAMIGCGFSSLNNSALSSLGVAVITYPSDQIAEEINASSRGIGLFYDMYGSDHSAGALMAWAWGMSRLIDAIEKTHEANIDPNRLGVTGCSRWGKGALVCGAFDERIKLTIPQESGSGGAASWRVSQYQQDVLGQTVQTLGEITGENCWFRANFNRFNNAVNKVPFDHHMVAALCAPRALLIIENTSMEWLGNLSTWTNGNVTHMIYEALGIPDRMGFSQVGHGNHCVFPSSQQPEVTAYVQKFLVGGGTGNTNVMRTDGVFTFDEARWVDWTVPNPIKGDLNHDCRVGYSDLGLLAARWLEEDCLYNGWCYEADLTYNGRVDLLDYAELAANWLEGN
jgi:hypothetical protein